MNPNLDILLIDDHPLLREGVKLHIDAEPDMRVAAEAATVNEALRLLRTQPFAVVLLDIGLPDGSGWEVLSEIRKMATRPAVLVLSQYKDEDFALYALKSGADGFLNKVSMADELLVAIRRVVAGSKYASQNIVDQVLQGLSDDHAALLPHERLSEREFLLMMRIAEGKSLVAIGEELFISPKTVTTYRRRMLEKLELGSNSDVTRYAVENGLLH